MRKAEIATLSTGDGVFEIKGNQKTTATFLFTHPLQGALVDREVVFQFEQGEWRASG